MKIREIREAIQFARYVRRDVTGGTPGEFLVQNVPERLDPVVSELKSLVIPERFTEERRQRDEEIGNCEDTIARWRRERTEQARQPRPLIDFETASAYVYPEPLQLQPVGDRLYTNGTVVLKVINGGKK